MSKTNKIKVGIVLVMYIIIVVTFTIKTNVDTSLKMFVCESLIIAGVTLALSFVTIKDGIEIIRQCRKSLEEYDKYTVEDRSAVVDELLNTLKEYIIQDNPHEALDMVYDIKDELEEDCIIRTTRK